MRVVVQRVLSANVSASDGRHVAIGPGLLVLLGIAPDDGDKDIGWMAHKIASLRIFNDCAGKMNLSLKETDGEIIVVSQFTLYADASKGNRPGFSGSARFDQAQPLYDCFVERLEGELEKPVKTGWYRADMQVSLVNDGPVTLIIDSPKCL
jgi:D-tyrosyl-tRNA(Tyr) deacylase